MNLNGLLFCIQIVGLANAILVELPEKVQLKLLAQKKETKKGTTSESRCVIILSSKLGHSPRALF